MSDLRKAAEMALEALERTGTAGNYSKESIAIQALRQALAQPEQEQPKHWSDCAVYNEPAYPNGECDCGGFDPNNKWHGLTEEEAEKLAFDVIFDGVSKRVRKALAQPKDTKCKDHPDAPHGFNRNASLTEDRYVCDCEYWEPPKREWVGLTDAERKACWHDSLGFYRTIETASKEMERILKEKNGYDK